MLLMVSLDFIFPGDTALSSAACNMRSIILKGSWGCRDPVKDDRSPPPHTHTPPHTHSPTHQQNIMLYYFWQQGKGLPVKTESSVFLSYITLQSNAVLCSVFLWWCKSFFFFFFFLQPVGFSPSYSTSQVSSLSSTLPEWVEIHRSAAGFCLQKQSERERKGLGKQRQILTWTYRKTSNGWIKNPCSCFGIFFQLAGTRADQKNGKCQQTL